MAFNISQPIDVRSKCANIDILYGPYDSIGAACTAIIPARRVIGRTVGIINNGSILEYWWKAGLEDSDLVQKVEQLNLTLQSVGETSFTKDEGEPIYAQFRVDGGAGVKRAMLYQVTGGSEVYIQDYTNIGKGSPYTFNIPNPAMSGVYTYRIKVLDNLDSYATTTEDTNYVEYTLYYGGISTIYNMTNLNAIKVKNYTSVADVEFQINISVRDSSFSVNSVILTDGTDQEGHRIPLTPYTSQSEISDTFIGNYHYYMPNSTTLKRFDGQEIYIEVGYTEGGFDRVKIQDFFRLLDVGIIELIPEHEGDNYYATLPGYYSFTIQAGVENLSITLTRDIDTDFDFEQSTVSAYRRFTLKVIPHDIEKDNAQLVMRYFYIYDNREYSGTITRTIGNILPIPPQSYYEPEEGSTVSRETLVYADVNDNDGSDDGQYYKIISENVTAEQLSSSFILDTYCKINQKNDKSIKYITITYGGVEIATINEDEISCTNKWGSLYTDTPINEWTQIGIGINLREGIQRGEEMEYGYYHAIYINGMVVKTVQIDSSNEPLYYNQSSRLVVTIGNGILVQKSFLYYRNDEQNIISPNTDIESIIYNNYKSHKADFHEPGNLPVLKFLRISDTTISDNYFNLINAYKSDPEHEEDLIVHTAKFGKIGDTKANDMAHYDPYYSSPVIESNATLFSQSVNIKKPAQKEYAVLCQAKWGDDIMRNIIVECHTQGTSTLVYAVPNFKFTFWELYQDQGVDKVKKYYPRFIKKEGTEDEYYHECVYTAKADFMDSSHLNNTPTCNYYNKLIKDILDDGNVQGFTGSPSARNGMLDAIMGFPIVMEISDNAESFEDKFTNIGSFMLNIDKTGNSLGFEVEEGGQTLSCISFEGTSNDNNTGASGRFDIPDEIKLPYGDGKYSVTIPSLKVYNTDAEIETDYNTAKAAIKNLSNVDALLTLPYVQWCNFLSQGLEYRYPDSDMYKEKNGKVSKIMNKDHFIELYHMWWWVYNSDNPNLSQQDYKSQFTQYFDLYYCMIYFINLMTYAQTDNLGKNAMFDYWFGDGKWYPRPYDLDSEAGLDNNGNDNVAPFVEIRTPFSLNYDISKETDWDWRVANFLVDDNDVAENPDVRVDGQPLKISTIQYGSQKYDRYHFSSNKSKLWINFYKNFKDEIEAFYANIRDKFNYGPESIIELCDNVLIEKLGTNQYNKDFQNKYLATKDQTLGYGNRWYKFKKWITKRFAFCDSYFGATETATYNVISRINYNIKVDAPQYVAQRYQSNLETKFVLDTVSFNAGSGAATKTTLLVNQPSVFETSLFKYVDIDSGDTNFRNLITLDVSGNQNSGFNNITRVTGTNLDNLKYLNISNSAVKNLTVPPNVKTLVAENVNLSSFIIPDNCAVEQISLRGSTFLDDISFDNLPNLHTLDLRDCTFNGVVRFSRLPKLENLIMDKAIFNGDVVISVEVHVNQFTFKDLSIHNIVFDGSNLEIDSLNFYNTTFGVTFINLNAIRENIRDIIFDNCKGLQHLQLTGISKFNHLNCFSIYNSSIKSLGESTLAFDCQYFNNMSSLKRLSSFRVDGTPIYTNFTFQDTVIEKITNLSWSGTGASLFANCFSLTSIGGQINLATSANSMFYRCYALTTLPTIQVASSVTSATYMFAGTNSLSYTSAIKSVIRNCTHVTDFSHALKAKQFDTDETISLTELFENNNSILYLNNFLSCYTEGGRFPSVTNKIRVTGTLPSTVKQTIWMLYYINNLTVPYNILSTAESLENATAMFAYSNVTFDGQNNLPTQQDSHGENVTLTHAVNRSFFNYSYTSKITTVAQMFYASNVITNDATLFYTLGDLTSTNATFGGSLKAFTFVNSQNETERIDLNVSSMWANNTKINDISGCFANVYNVFCNALQFSASITSGSTINISGLFGISDATYKDVAPITISLDGITPKLITDSYYAVPNNGNAHGPGVFQNRNVSINTVPVGGEIFSKITSSSRDMFNGTTLYLPSNITTFNLSNVSYCDNMFEGCRLYTQRESPHTYDATDRKFVNVTLPTNCSSYIAMFKNSSVLLHLPNINSAGVTNMKEMYRHCVINEDNLALPANYFQICSNTLSDVSYMFYENMYITTLTYNNLIGLFSNCTNLSNVAYMFSGAYFLHKGIPVNLFGNTDLPKLTSLAYMFNDTSIIYDVENDSHKWFDSSTIQPLVNLENISGMFRITRIHLNEYTQDGFGTLNQKVLDTSYERAVIDPSTFASKTFTNISNLFEHSRYNPTEVGKLRFMGFTIGKDALFGSNITDIHDDFVDELCITSIANVDRMCYQPPITGPLYHSTVNGLSNFINKIKNYPNISKNNIAGNLVDANIDTVYKQATTEGDANESWGHSLQHVQPQNADTQYGRYFFT